MFLAENLRNLIKHRGISQTDLSKKLDISTSTVNNWLQGVALPHFETLIKLRLLLDFNLDEMIFNKIEFIENDNSDEMNIGDNPISPNELKEPEVKYKARNTEGVKIEVINNERDMYERLLKEKDALIKQQTEMIELLKDQVKLLRG